MDIRFSAMFGWLLAFTVVVVGFGVYPTWMVAGVPGLWAQLSAGVIVLTVMIFNGWATISTADQGPSHVSGAFSASSIVRVALCPLLAWGVWVLTDLPARPLFTWLVIFYLTSLGAECVWVARALRRHARRIDAGEVPPPVDPAHGEKNDDL